MRLRRETGDFQIVVKAGEEAGTYVANSIRPGLSAEDFVGEVVKIEFGSCRFCAITQVYEAPGTVMFMAITSSGPVALTYIIDTGVIGATAAGSGGNSGGNSSSNIPPFTTS